MSGGGHTPGPWRVDGKWNVRGPEPRDSRVAIVDAMASFAECQANARLIAAAPALLAALQRLLARAEADYISHWEDTIATSEAEAYEDELIVARAALAAARGVDP
jgi:hypothetical protein